MKHAATLAFLIFLPVIVGSTIVDAQQYEMYYPTPPPSQTMSATYGVLSDWGSGSGGGSFAIKSSSGAIVVFTEGGPSVTVNGIAVDCFRAPRGSATPNPTFCKNWPGLRLGSTQVVVFYWTSVTGDGITFKISNRLLAGAAALPTIASLKRKPRARI